MNYNSKDRVAVVVNTIMFDKADNRNAQLTFLEMTEKMAFYYNRLRSLHMYSLHQARELVKMICRCAFNDSQLTDDESIVIMETCLDTRLDNILMEVNFNACW